MKKQTVSKSHNKGVLYIRYDKDTDIGIVIEKIKEKIVRTEKSLNDTISELILIHGGLETLEKEDIGDQNFYSFHRRCLNLYGGRLEEIKHKLSIQEGFYTFSDQLNTSQAQNQNQNLLEYDNDKNKEKIDVDATQLIDLLMPEI